jgi:hypothetical protein
MFEYAQRFAENDIDVSVLTLESINAAAPHCASSEPALILKTEVLLDRDGFSPGEIDGKNGDNFRKALAAFQQANNLKPSGKLDADTWNALPFGQHRSAAHFVHDFAKRRGWPI